jgi:hypothetical protein
MSKAAELANLIGNINAGGGGVNRNVIINGAMNVAQRGTSSTGLGATDGYYTIDRFNLNLDSANSGRFTMTQDSSAPSGFANSLKLACTTADTSIAAGERLQIEQRIEGQNLQAFAKGTSDAKPFAVSFYVKGNASATYVCELFDEDNSRQCSKTFNVTTDWTRVELTFPADTTGAFDDDNNSSLLLIIFLHAGSTFAGGTLNSSSFASVTNANRAAGGSSFFDSTDRTFFITGVQLEVGQNATEFEHEPFDVTRRKCFRYFEKVEVTAGSYAHIGYAYTSTFTRSKQTYEKKRANPTFTFDNQGDVIMYYNGNSSDADPTFNYHDAGPNSCRVSATLTGVSTTQGYAVAAYVNGSATYNIKVDAEL